MGACGSRPKVSEGSRMGLAKKKNRRRRRILRRRVSSRKIDAVHSFGERKLSHTNSALQGSNRASDVAWFDSTSALGSDDEFYSIYDDGSEIASRPSDSSPNAVDCSESKHSSIFSDQQQKLRVHPYTYFRSNSILKTSKNHDQSKDSTLKLDGPRAEVTSVSAGEVSTSHIDHIREDKKLTPDHCGLIPNTCLPCLSSTVLSVEKRRPSSPETPSSRRKSLSKLSFKWKEGYSDVTLFSPKALKQKPLAGSLIPFCPIDKQMQGSWSPIEPSSFKVRGKNYFRDKKKDFAPKGAAFYPFGADIFLSQRKIDHIARFVQLPAINIAGDVPSILVVNIQIPLYSATIFQSENDGEGINVVLYFKVSEKYSKDLLDQFREHISGENYFEIDLDVHRFSYIARKGFEGFIERLQLCVLDFGLTIQGNKAEDLPEHILCAVRLNKIDYTCYNQLCC